MSDSRMKINIDDKEQLSDFIKTSVLSPMKNKLTGQVTIHYLDGEIRGCETNQMSKTLDDIKRLWGE